MNANKPFSLLALTAALLCGSAPASAAGGPGGSAAGAASGAGSRDAIVAGEVLVKLRSADALPALLVRHPLTLASRFGSRPIYRLKVIGATRVKDVLAALALEPDVMIAEANATHQSPEARKNVPWVIGTPQEYVAQWAPQALRLAEAQQVASGSGVRVAVLDTGVDSTHPLLAGRLARGFDFVDDDNDPSEVGSAANQGYGHGTHVAGLIAMAAPGATIVPLRVLDADGVGNAWVLAEAMLYAIDPDGDPNTDDGAHVINLSLGSFVRTRLIDAIASIAACEPALADDAITDRSDPGYNDDAIRCNRAAGAVIVAAAGNDASSNVKEYPAAEGAHGLLAITASNSGNRLASFSNFGSWVGLAAPGEGLTSAAPGGGYATWSGTSMAAPLAAGVAALLRSLDPALSPEGVVRRLQQSSALLCGTQIRRIDAAAAVKSGVPPLAVCP
jgi:subtilisin family serine protease